MEATATLRNLRISPRKVRLVLNLIRGKEVEQALGCLTHTHRGASSPVKTLLESAIANADNLNPDADLEGLFVKEAYANQGVTLKRFRPRAMGRASRINKRSCHVTIVVGNEA